ncbi:MAG: biopolymer transporter ExbD [bacterium]|nr:biopolymer transporter ExbD [bacterium]
MIFKRRCKIERGKLDIAPLIDVVLLLLIFFMLSSSMVLQTAFRIDLPRSPAAAVQGGRTVKLTIDRSGRLFWQGKRVEREELDRKMADLAAAEPGTLVVLDADRGVRHGDVVGVMGMAHARGLRRLAIAAELEAAERK